MIETNRLNLRTFQLSDKDFLYKLNNDKVVNKYRSTDTISIERCLDSIKTMETELW